MFRRCLTVILAAMIAVPAVPVAVSLGLAGGPAYADDDDFDFRIPRFRMINPPRVPRIPRIPRVQPPRRANPPASAPAITIPDRVPGEIVIRAVSTEILSQVLADGFTLVNSAPAGLVDGVVARLRPPPGVDLEAARDRVRQIDPAAIVEPNHLYRPVEMPCRDGNCIAFEMVGWRIPSPTCGTSVTIGMIDTTVNTGHEALQGRSIEVLRLVEEGETPATAVHGTAIAALLVGDDGSRTPGLLPDARLVAVEAFHRDVAGDAADVYAIVRGLDALQERGVRIVNLSFAGPANELLELAAARATANEMILVAAAGNRGPRAEPAYPAAYDGVVAVTAVNRDNQVYRNAGRGDHIAFAAPGVGLWTAASISGGRYRSGTSYAVPFVAAAYASALAAEPGVTSAMLTTDLSDRSADLGDPGRDPVFGWGLIKAPPC